MIGARKREKGEPRFARQTKNPARAWEALPGATTSVTARTTLTLFT
jgi:hypothetical protein